MLNSFFGYVFLFIGLFILAIPLILVELSRPRDWLMGGLVLLLGLFLVVENDFLRGSINLFVISTEILFGIMISEIIQNRWYRLSAEERERIGSFERWLESLKQLAQISAFLGNSFLNFFRNLRTQSEKPEIEKKWVHPELNEEIKKQVDDKSSSIYSKKNHEKRIK